MWWRGLSLGCPEPTGSLRTSDAAAAQDRTIAFQLIYGHATDRHPRTKTQVDIRCGIVLNHGRILRCRSQGKRSGAIRQNADIIVPNAETPDAENGGFHTHIQSRRIAAQVEYGSAQIDDGGESTEVYSASLVVCGDDLMKVRPSPNKKDRFAGHQLSAAHKESVAAVVIGGDPARRTKIANVQRATRDEDSVSLIAACLQLDAGQLQIAVSGCQIP